MYNLTAHLKHIKLFAILSIMFSSVGKVKDLIKLFRTVDAIFIDTYGHIEWSAVIST